MKFICGNSNLTLGKAIAAHTNVPWAERNVRRFLSGNAVERINASDLSSSVFTDMIGAAEAASASLATRCTSIAPMFAKAITPIANGESVSVLWE